MADYSKQNLLQLIKRIGVYLSTKVSKILNIQVQTSNSLYHLSEIYELFQQSIFLWKLICSCCWGYFHWINICLWRWKTLKLGYIIRVMSAVRCPGCTLAVNCRTFQLGILNWLMFHYLTKSHAKITFFSIVIVTNNWSDWLTRSRCSGCAIFLGYSGTCCCSNFYMESIKVA